jgi:hypothetical protein
MDKCPTCGKIDVKWKDTQAIDWAIETLGLDEANEKVLRQAIAGEGRLVFIGKEEIMLCIGEEAKFKKGEAVVVIPDCLRQDQGGE